MLLYIHGFNSSPLSEKAVVTANYLAKHFPDTQLFQPQLANTPQAAMQQLSDIVENAISQGLPLRFIGSSLGGYFASYLVEKYGGKAVLVNPAVRPFELFDEFIGAQHNPYTEQDYEIMPIHKQEVAEFDTQVVLNPDRFFVLLQSGDEVLDYKQALEKYHCCKMIIESGGDHSFMGYEKHLQSISQFLQLP
ncbi:YqiA/YcfP family alpha/beta fold hydrolase [Shewanella gelidii]|uniref:Esterase n=1 Tax=Shewanella gelidii TaxID=1642821 RepID=A0A917NAY2_9GAMM|nr:YqiA/YcfP family alpha/beta fold hydrolase [Shewanella gelidii]MCL1097727.1 esterase YqiA [Shewanella gelidii]GGI79272.1 esterase [Shewanella gelidii]